MAYCDKKAVDQNRVLILLIGSMLASSCSSISDVGEGRAFPKQMPYKKWITALRDPALSANDAFAILQIKISDAEKYKMRKIYPENHIFPKKLTYIEWTKLLYDPGLSPEQRLKVLDIQITTSPSSHKAILYKYD